MAAHWHTVGTLLKIRLMASNEIMKGAAKLKQHFTTASRVWGVSRAPTTNPLSTYLAD